MAVDAQLLNKAVRSTHWLPVLRSRDYVACREPYQVTSNRTLCNINLLYYCAIVRQSNVFPIGDMNVYRGGRSIVRLFVNITLWQFFAHQQVSRTDCIGGLLGPIARLEVSEMHIDCNSS